jgi:hypothetical protein
MKQENDFTKWGTLKTLITFEAAICVKKKTCKVLMSQVSGEVDQTKIYWILQDEFGASFSTRNKRLGEAVRIGETYLAKGEIGISRGNMFLNVKSLEYPNGENLLATSIKEELLHE